MKLVKYIISLILLSIIAIFCAVNRQDVDIHVIPRKIDIELPLCILIITLLIIGFMIAKILNFKKTIQHMLEIRTLNKQINFLKDEIASIKVNNITISGDHSDKG